MTPSEVFTGHSKSCGSAGRRSHFVFQKGDLHDDLLAYLRGVDILNQAPEELASQVAKSAADQSWVTWRNNDSPRAVTADHGWVLSVTHALNSIHGEVSNLRAMREPRDQPYHPSDVHSVFQIITISKFHKEKKQKNNPVSASSDDADAA